MKFKIRNSKHQIRNKFKIQMFKIQNKKSLLYGGIFCLLWSLKFRSFKFVSNFGFRYSDFTSMLHAIQI
jgi:hypothetical protein